MDLPEEAKQAPSAPFEIRVFLLNVLSRRQSIYQCALVPVQIQVKWESCDRKNIQCI